MADEQKLYATTDAAVWAEEFLKLVEAGATVDFGLMVGWFANAMATAESHEAAKARDQAHAIGLDGKCATCDESEVVVLPRSALFEFFGRMALPPWRDERGRDIGGGIDCAPIASEITEWVDAHDLTGVIPGPPTGEQ